VHATAREREPVAQGALRRVLHHAAPRTHHRDQERLSSIKSQRSADKLKWEDYFENGVLAAVSAEMNATRTLATAARASTGWKPVWPGNDAVKEKFVATLRQTQSKSSFAED